MRKQRLGAFFLLVLLFPGNAAAGPGMLGAAGAAQGAYGNSSEVPALIVRDICSPNRSRGNSGSALLWTILFPWSSIFGYSPLANMGAPRGAYEDSPQGLARLVVDICAAKRAQNFAALDKLFNGLILPNHEAWMVATFGEATGKRMAATYAQRRDEVPALLSSGFSTLIEEGPTNAEISSSSLPIWLGGKGTEPDIVLEMFRPTRIYHVRFSSADRTNTKNQGVLLLVYVKGGFRLFPAFRPAPVPTATVETFVTPMPITKMPVGGVPGGVEGGVPGGIPGGVVGGVIGELPGASAPPPPKASAQPLRVSGSVMQSNLLRKVEPAYPPLARQARISGVVILEVTVARDGSIRTVRALSGHPLLMNSAVEAAKQWKYQPTLLNGEAVEVVTTVTVAFRLD